jgi:ABC-type transporter Mla subunit MlaD
MASSTLEQGIAGIADRLSTQRHTRLSSLRAQLAQEQEDFEMAADGIETVLSALEAKVAQFGDQLNTRLSGAKGEIDTRHTHLDGLMSGVVNEVNQRAQVLDAADGEIERAANDLGTSFESTLSGVTAAAGELKSAFEAWIEMARKGFGDADSGLRALRQSADAFNTFCGSAAGDLVGRFQEVTRELELVRGGIVDDWTQARGQLEQGTQQLLVGGVAQDFQGEVQRLLGVLSTLRGGADSAANVLGGDMMRLMNSLRQISDLIAQIEPILRVVDELA